MDKETIIKYLNFETKLTDDYFDDFNKFPKGKYLDYKMLEKGFNKFINQEISFEEYELWCNIALFAYAKTLEADRYSLSAHFAQSFKFYVNNYLYRFELDDELIAFTRNIRFELYGDEYFSNMSHDVYMLHSRLCDLEDLGFDDETKDEYFSILNRLASLNDENGLIELGKLYYEGDILKKDIKKAYEYFTRSSNKNNPRAMIFLGDIYFKGELDNKPNYEKAYEYYNKASLIGGLDVYCDAMYKISIMYDKGLYLTKDRKKAFTILNDLYKFKCLDTLGSNEVMAPLAFNLAKAYSDDGFMPNKKLALAFYLKANYLFRRLHSEIEDDKKMLDMSNKAISKYSEGTKKQLSIDDVKFLINNSTSFNGYQFKYAYYDKERKELILELVFKGEGGVILPLGMVSEDYLLFLSIPVSENPNIVKNVVNRNNQYEYVKLVNMNNHNEYGLYFKMSEINEDEDILITSFKVDDKRYSSILRISSPWFDNINHDVLYDEMDEDGYNNFMHEQFLEYPLEITLDNDYLDGPIHNYSEYNEHTKEMKIATGIDVIDNNELINQLSLSIYNMYQRYFYDDDNEPDGLGFNEELKNKEQDVMNKLINQLVDELDRINDGTFKIIDRLSSKDEEWN